MEWSHPWNDPERTDWAAGKAVDPTGNKVTQNYSSLATDSGRKDLLAWNIIKNILLQREKIRR